MDAEIALDVVNSIASQNETRFLWQKFQGPSDLFKTCIYILPAALEAQTRFASPSFPTFHAMRMIPLPHIVLFVGQCGGGECGTLIYA